MGIMNHPIASLWVAVAAMATLALSHAAAPAAAPASTLEALAARVGAKPADLRVTPIPGIYEYRRGAELVYVTEDGRYAFAGDLYLMSDKSNLSDVRRRELRLALLKPMPESQMLVFAPRDPKYTITVFTDVDCSYCRVMHQQIADYNRLGIKVRYLAFPRGGPDTESWTKAEQVWCAQDRKAALTRAKQGEKLNSNTCASNPVAREYELGRAIGLTGTPGILTESGELLPGYLPPANLLQLLQSGAGTRK